MGTLLCEPQNMILNLIDDFVNKFLNILIQLLIGLSMNRNLVLIQSKITADFQWGWLVDMSTVNLPNFNTSGSGKNSWRRYCFCLATSSACHFLQRNMPSMSINNRATSFTHIDAAIFCYFCPDAPL